MGYRTLVIFNNDHIGLATDAGIGKAVQEAISEMTLPIEHRRHTHNPAFHAVSQTHNDTSELVLIEGFNVKVMANSFWSTEEIEVALLKQMADKLGYRVSKKPKKS